MPRESRPTRWKSWRRTRTRKERRSVPAKAARRRLSTAGPRPRLQRRARRRMQARQRIKAPRRNRRNPEAELAEGWQVLLLSVAGSREKQQNRPFVAPNSYATCGAVLAV